jgi:hypothetical protein
MLEGNIITQLSWSISLLIIAVLSRPLKKQIWIELYSQCPGSENFKIEKINSTFRTVLGAVYIMSIIGLVSWFFISRGRPGMLRIVGVVLWIAVIVISAPVFR